MEHDNDRPVEIKDLNKTQLILLALLLSFVTSIATGITTVTLMQQAPEPVTQTINRVVQHTIEKVAPDYAPGKVQTVVVKEDDLVVDAVSATRVHFANMYFAMESADPFDEAFSLGGGKFMTTAFIEKDKEYALSIGADRALVKTIGYSEFGFSILSVVDTSGKLSNLPKPNIGKDSMIKVGQTAVVIAPDAIDKGIVQSVTPRDIKNEAGEITATHRTIALGKTLLASFRGAPVTNLDGQIVGFVLPRVDGNQIMGADTITKALAELSV